MKDPKLMTEDELKARAYDAISMIEELKGVLNIYNNEINKRRTASKPVIEETLKEEKS